MPWLPARDCATLVRRVACLSIFLATVSVCLVPFSLAASAAEDSSWNVRIAWGGGTARQWRGTIAINDGTLGLLAPLGIEADEPGSMWCEDGKLVIEQPSPRSYDGLDLTAVAPRTAKLTITLMAGGSTDAAQPHVVEVPLQQLIEQYHTSAIDDQGNQLLVRRTPGDPLRIEPERASLIFQPGETFKARLRPNVLPIAGETKVRFKLELRSASTDEQKWVQHVEHTLPLAPPAAGSAAGLERETSQIAVEFPLPEQEGVYNLMVEAATLNLRTRLGLKQVLSRRWVQLLVLSPTVANENAASWQTAHEFDPANVSWLKRISDLPLPGFRSGPLGNGASRIREYPLGRIVELAAGGSDGDSWQAYPLPISTIGVPHILEIDVPSDIPQSLGISVLESGTGRTTPATSLDSGFDLPAASNGSRRWLKHRLVFWPRTAAPWVLLHNRRPHMPAVYGKVRLLTGPAQLPPRQPSEFAPERSVFAYLDKPMFSDNFSGPKASDAWSGRALDDWSTFYLGGTRLVEYLRHLGYGGAMLTVAADGSAIYPSDLLQPTPRFDTGSFFVSGQDVVRKDVLEMLLQLFDRHQLKLIPAIDFSGTLPELESILRAGGVEAEGLVWVGSDGLSWRQRYPGGGPLAYYNPLHPRVQSAMLQVVRELAQRCSGHPSFQGISLQLSAQGFAQLPGGDWGFDDTTIARFTLDTGIDVPGSGPNRFAVRSQFLLGPQRAAWLNWRAGVMKNLYRAIRREIVLARPDAFLVLSGGRLLDGPPWQTRLVPTLPQRLRAENVLLELGLDPQLHREPGLVLLRPEPIGTSISVGAVAPQLNWEVAAALSGPRGAGVLEASVFQHATVDPQSPSFVSLSPFVHGVGWTAAQLPPAAEFNRRRFARHMAAFDTQMFFDGGLMLPLGQEEPLSEFLAVLRELPAAGFQTLEHASQPLTVRTAVKDDRTWIYLVNDSPWQTKARVYLQATSECQLTRLGLDPRVVPLQNASDGLIWQLEIEPYGLAGGWLNALGIKVTKVEVDLPPDCRQPLTARLEDLAARAASLRNPPTPLALANRSFEEASPADSQAGPIASWTASTLPGTQVELDRSQAHQGLASVKLRSDGPLLTLASNPMKPPQTGRFAVSVWLRVADPNQQPSLRLAIDGLVNGGQYYRHASVGAGERVVKIQDRWTQFIFQVHDLPTRDLSQLRIRFDLMGQGEVWIDEVQCFDLLFNRDELIELSKLITLAGVKLQNNEMTDCLRLLEGHWSRFLLTNVPPVTSSNLATNPSPATQDSESPASQTPLTAGEMPPTATPSDEAPRTGFKDRMKQFVPRWMRF